MKFTQLAALSFLSFPFVACGGSIASVQVDTPPTCSQHVTGLTVSATCINSVVPPAGTAFASASADFLVLSVDTVAKMNAFSSATASYDEFVTVSGGVPGSDTLVGSYGFQSSGSFDNARVCLTQGIEGSLCISSHDYHGVPLVLFSTFTYGVPLEMSGSLSVSGAFNDNPDMASLSAISFTDQNGNPLTLQVITPEPAAGGLVLLGVVALRLRRLQTRINL